MNKYMIGACAAGLLMSMSGCANFDDLNTDPNATMVVTPGMIATNMIVNMTWVATDGYFTGDKLLPKYWLWGASANEYSYNKLGRTGFDYSAFRNGAKMLELALLKNKTPKAYEGLYLFTRAYKAFGYSMWLGDIPYSEAGRGETEGLVCPKYDTQEFVMQQILQDLKRASRLFSEASNFEGDPLHGGDVVHWRKITNAMRLKVLINLYKKEKVGDIDVKAEFKDIYENELLMQSPADNFAISYNSMKENERYPWHEDVTDQEQYTMISGVLIDLLKKYEDGRLFMYAEAAAKIVPDDTPWDDWQTWQDWDAFPSIDPMEPWTTVQARYLDNDYTRLNRHYTKDYDGDWAGEPIRYLGYEEMMFNLAEGALRGWINADPQELYSQAVRTALKYADEQCPNYFSHGFYFDDNDINNYLERVKLTGDFENKLRMIMEQKYIAGFMSFGYDAWFENRRTGYPVFPNNPATSLNSDVNKMPLRCMYPDAETTVNYTNLQEALDRQYGGVDDVNKAMWILK